MDNQFLSTPLLTDKHRKKDQLANSLSKSQLIKGLQLKNNKLRTQILKIEAAINETLDGDDEKTDKQQKNQKRVPIMRSEENHPALTKQLANAYKRVKMYEYEINKMEEAQSSNTLIAKARQVQTMIKEKKSMSERLKNKLNSEQKIMNENMKKLHNNSMQESIERKMKNLSDQIKFLRQRQKEAQGRDQIKTGNMKKQFQFIKKLENELVQSGLAGGQLEEIRQKAIKKYQNISGGSQSHVIKNQNSRRREKDDLHLSQVIQDRTKDHYKMLQNEIKILDKIQADHEKKIMDLENDKMEEVSKNQDSRDRLLQTQDEIQNLQKEVLVLKGKVIPSNMKPLRPLRSVSSHHTADQKKKIYAKNVSANKGSKSLVHPIKFDQVGIASEKGQRFTDRNILGKTNLGTKITGITVFIDKQAGVICGVQCTYGHKKRGGEYLKRDRDTKEKQYHQESFNCDQKQFIKSISGTLSPDDKLQSIYVISSTNRSHRFGEANTTRKSFTFDIAPDEVPVCVFGSLLSFKQPGKKEHSIIEHFGVEVYSDRNTKKSEPNDS